MKILILFILIPFVSSNTHAGIDAEINECVEKGSTEFCCMIKGRLEDLFYESFEAGIVKKETFSYYHVRMTMCLNEREVFN